MKIHEQFLLVHDAIESLPVHYREAMSLRHFEGKSIAEIGEILGKKSGTVKSLLSRGFVLLRKILEGAVNP